MKILTAYMLLFIGLTAGAQETKIYTTEAGAIKGYDPVAYFIDNKPVKGSEQYSYTWKEAAWYFRSQENLELFKSDPEKYAPQYGGYCAYGLSKGGFYKIEPEAWTIVDGKLYLNYDMDVQQTWEKKQGEFIQKADANWAKLKKD